MTDWQPPWKPGPQAHCQGSNCRQGSLIGLLCMEAALKDGLCAACRRVVDDSDRKLRFDV